jgi:hypothetical protein
MLQAYKVISIRTYQKECLSNLTKEPFDMKLQFLHFMPLISEVVVPSYHFELENSSIFRDGGSASSTI